MHTHPNLSESDSQKFNRHSINLEPNSAEHLHPANLKPQGALMITINGATTGGIENCNLLNKPSKPSGQRDWSFDIFDCFSARGTFFFACCFPCFVFSKNNLRLRHVNMQGDIYPASGNIVRWNVSWRLTPVMTLNTSGLNCVVQSPSASLMVSRYVPAPHVVFTWLSAMTSATATTLRE